MHCPALLISAIASGQGKTTTTAALARRAVREGRRVRVFKVGPDFIDPTILERASGQPVYQLDLWMGGLEDCRRLLFEAGQHADLLLIEGVMGLYDGTPSTADLAKQLGLPVAAVIDGAAMGQTFGALTRGLRDMPGAPRIAGVIANRVDSDGHERLLAESLPADVPILARLPQSTAHELPQRHLGLHQAFEIDELDARLDVLANALVCRAGIENLTPCELGPPAAHEHTERLLAGKRIGIARDAAFSFVYPANLDALKALGAAITFFSPLHDPALPEVDAVYLPGGYPELHASTFAANRTMHEALRRQHLEGKPIVAECGGMMALLSSLVDVEGKRFAMAGVLPGETRMQPRVQAIAPQAFDWGHGELRGHTFHHSRLEAPMKPLSYAHNPLGGPGEAVFHDRALTASYMHFYFPSNLRATAALFGVL